jgi:tRNA(fMet)-specific endonuclease VapC
MNPSLIDTDTLSAMTRRDLRVRARASQYFREHGTFSFSEMTRFEVLRGLEARKAHGQIARFRAACRDLAILPITPEIPDRAAVIYGELHRAGQLIPDADLIIGVTALVHGLEMVTNNVRHFARIPGLVVVNWLEA